jgi:hypothetical protein
MTKGSGRLGVTHGRLDEAQPVNAVDNSLAPSYFSSLVAEMPSYFLTFSNTNIIIRMRDAHAKRS